MPRRPLLRRAGLGLLPGLLAVLALSASAAAPLAAQSPAAPDVGDLPLVEVTAAAPAPGAAPAGSSTPSSAARSVAVLITGDGDWAPIDRGIAAAVAEGGVPVVGLKVRAYLSGGAHGARTPDDLARDVARVARTYMARWGRDRLVLLGYSRGADYLPFVANRLAPDLRDRVTLLGMYAADRDASFEYHVLDLLIDRRRGSDVPVGPELARTAASSNIHVLCVYGADEADSPCRTAPATPAVRAVARGAGHHLDKDYPGLGRLALEELARGADRRP